MMTNLFSIFDPVSPNFFSSNWLSMLLFLICLPPIYWIFPNRVSILFIFLFNYIFIELKMLIKKSPFVLITMLSLFLIIMFNNVLGLLPYIFTASSHLVFTVGLALPLWLSLMLYGWMNNMSNLLIHLIPQGTPVMLMSFMVLIETVSTLIRPITLAVRLCANMIAGHLLIVLLSSSFLVLPFFSVPILFASQVMLSMLEIAVAFIQAYVFSVLITLYVAESIN